ncbi:MAG: SipW-dependent-type signal peptide-containing protein [Dehalococcoidia bacterium]
MKKLGLLSLALVLALGALGIGYAAWTDQVTIEGTVTTGTLSLQAIAYSGTQVFKMEDGGALKVEWQNREGVPPAWPDDAIQLVADSGARPGVDDERDVVVWFNNLFPCFEYKANVKLHCAGSVPIHVKAELLPLDEETEQLMADIIQHGGYVKVEGWLWNSLDEDEEDAVLVDPCNFIQMHNCDILKLVLIIYIPQHDDLMSRSGSFEVDINAIQYNKEAQYDDYFPYNGGLVA